MLISLAFEWVYQCQPANEPHLNSRQDMFEHASSCLLDEQ